MNGLNKLSTLSKIMTHYPRKTLIPKITTKSRIIKNKCKTWINIKQLNE